MFEFVARTTWKLITVLDQPVGQATRKASSRGMAIILALVILVLLSTAVVEFAYATRVNLALASNERDQLKSYYLARSGMNLSHLLLSFQFSLLEESRETDDDVGRLIGQAMRRSNFQMHHYIDLFMGPFNTGRLDSPIGGVSLTDTGITGFGEFTGRFDVKVIPEEGRIDVNQFARESIRRQDIVQLCSLVMNPQYDRIFEQEDQYGDILDRATVLQNLINYIDLNEEGLVLADDCTVQGSGGDERRPYDRDASIDIRPRNAKLTHVEEMYQVHGVTDGFMRAFKDSLTVYGVGRPNLNVATTPVFYSVLCQNARIEGMRTNPDQQLDLCTQSPQIAMEVLWLAIALDGMRAFFEDPLSVMLAYVGTTESKLLPSAQIGQPVAFLSVSQFPAFIADLQNDPNLVAQFVIYSPFYREMVMMNPEMAIDPLSPTVPNWTVSFDRTGLMRSVTARTPTIYRIIAEGVYGTTKTTLEAVVDFGKTFRRLPSENMLRNSVTDPEELNEMMELLREENQNMPIGRYLYWRQY